jgi:hypothetical protein
VPAGLFARLLAGAAASLHFFRRLRQATGMDRRGELKPESCEYAGADEVRVTLKN